MLYTTLEKIKSHGPCPTSWEKGLKVLNKAEADEDPVSMADLLEKMGVADAIWCFRAFPQHKKHWQYFAIFCAGRVKHLMKDPRSIEALEVAKQYLDGGATVNQLKAARRGAAYAAADAADAAAYAADAAGAGDAAAYAAAYAADAAGAGAAAAYAADAANAGAYAANAAADADAAAAYAANAERAAQEVELKRIFELL